VSHDQSLYQLRNMSDIEQYAAVQLMSY